MVKDGGRQRGNEQKEGKILIGQWKEERERTQIKEERDLLRRQEKEEGACTLKLRALQRPPSLE